MPVRPAPTTTAVAVAGSGARVGQIADVRLQLHRAVVGVDVVTELGQPGKVRLGHPAAQRQYQAVVAQGCAVGCAHRRSRSVDSGHVSGDMADTGRIEQVLQRDSARAEIGLVVADPNVVERLRTDDGDVDRAWWRPPSSSSRRAAPSAAHSPANPDPRTRTRVAGGIAISSQPADSQTRAGVFCPTACEIAAASRPSFLRP